MSTVLIPLSVLLLACVAAIFFGLIDSRALRGLVNCGKRKVLCVLWVVTGLGRGPKQKNLAGESEGSGSFADFVSGVSDGARSEASADLYAPLDMNVLNSRILIAELKEGDDVQDAFAVEICGTIHSPNEGGSAILEISILDVTDVTDGAPPEPVLAGSPHAVLQGQVKPREFVHVAEIGRLPRRVTTLDDWTAVARLRTDGLAFARHGRRMLQFKTSILSADGRGELAVAISKFAYDNPAPGYLDLEENTERTKVLTVALAFAVSAADNKLYDCEIELIKGWARENVLDGRESGSDESGAKLEKALSKTVAFFSEGNKLDTCKLCEEMVDIAPIWQRYEVLNLCLHVAKAKGSVTAEEMAVVKELASRLDVDATRFRTLMEKILSLEMHEVMDVEDVLGITADMGREGTRRHLNQEYRKWNSRVTSANPEIQSQADQMLKLIAEARGQYVSEDSTGKVAASRQ